MDDRARIDSLLEEIARLNRVIERCVMDKVRAGASEYVVRLDLGLLPQPKQWAEDAP